jgi:hypothetical protein
MVDANLDRATGTPCLIHCDVGLHNMLIDDGQISAMLDWELACLAPPAREIAKILHLIDYLMPREAFFAEYVAAGGLAEAVDPASLQFYAILSYMASNQNAPAPRTICSPAAGARASSSRTGGTTAIIAARGCSYGCCARWARSTPSAAEPGSAAHPPTASSALHIARTVVRSQRCAASW